MVVNAFARWPTVITVASIVLLLVICLAVDLAFGIYPAHQAAQMQPVEALRGV